MACLSIFFWKILGTTSRRCRGWVRLSTNNPNKPSGHISHGITGASNGGLKTPTNSGKKNSSMSVTPQSVAIIDVPVNCPEGYTPDPRGECREEF